MRARIIAVLLLGLVLAGCANTEVPERVVYKYKYVPVPSALLITATSANPPDPATYLPLECSAREAQALNFGKDQTFSLNLANRRLRLIDEWNEKQKKIYPE